MTTLRRLLAAHEDAIVEAGGAWVREAAAVDLAGRPAAETRRRVAESIPGRGTQLRFPVDPGA